MAAVAGIAVLAHGGVAGAIAEGFVALAVGGLLVAVWVRERRSGDSEPDEETGSLRDEE